MAHTVSNAQRNASGSIIWAELPLKDRQALGALDEHTEGIIDEMRSVQGVKIAALVKEMESGRTKISLRTNADDIDVSSLLAQEFGGGGHRKAAGASVDAPMPVVLQKLMVALEAAVAQSAC